MADKLIKEQFNAVTPENIMKAEIIQPGWNKYNFDLADKLVAFAQKNNIKVNAHNLIWHSQLPAFMQQNERCRIPYGNILKIILQLLQAAMMAKYIHGMW